MKYNKDFDQLDALIELGNISIGNAAASLSKLCNKEISTNIPFAGLVDFSEITHYLEADECDPFFSVFSNYSNDIFGNIFFVADEESAMRLKEVCFPESDLKNSDHSYFLDVGDILIGTYISSLSNFLNLEIHLTTPDFNYDMIGALLTHNLTNDFFINDKILLIKTNFFIENFNFNGSFLFFPDKKSQEILLRKSKDWLS